MNWINKDTEIYCSFAKTAGNFGCRLMNSLFFYHNLNKIYKSFSVNNIKEAVDAVKILDIKGFAITMPYKKEIVNYVDEVQDEVKTIGAANTVLNNNGYLKAYNTDYLAAKDLLITKSKKPVYVLGNGGYASAVKRALFDLTFNYVIITRKEWKEISNIKNSIIYNCTPVDNIEMDSSNEFIDCLITSKTGKRLAMIQALYQFELYTGINIMENFS